MRNCIISVHSCSFVLFWIFLKTELVVECGRLEIKLIDWSKVITTDKTILILFLSISVSLCLSLCLSLDKHRKCAICHKTVTYLNAKFCHCFNDSINTIQWAIIGQ